jgi:alpha-ketoglutaric semialdehyde dehydrogenase
MPLHGKNLIAGELSASGAKTFRVYAPASGGPVPPEFHEATPEEADRAMEAAALAFPAFRRLGPGATASFLERIAQEIEAVGPELIDRAVLESGLGPDRLTGERARTVNQLKMFAGLVRDGSWIDARIDRAMPDRKPLPKPDVRRMMIPIGPVVVFCATNFPLAFSVAGGDTASALAAGCPVVVKGNRAHAGTAELVAMAVQKAAAGGGVPPGAFSLVQGANHEINQRLVKHPAARAVGFTGSIRGGRELFDAAARRADPIPVYAEMGSVNPVFILPGALRERGDAIADGLKGSFTLGNGQFCTKPGMVFALEGEELARFTHKLAGLTTAQAPGTLLHNGILRSFGEGVTALSKVAGVQIAAQSASAADPQKTQARAALFATDASTFLKEHRLSEEVFGPSTLVVRCRSKEDFERIASGLEGHLTGTIHGTEADLRDHAGLVAILETKVGRLVFNAFPTGVEVCPSMNHGGPWPAASFANYTSVGTAAIYRWTRPVSYQGFPQDALPAELQNANPRKIWRLVDGNLSREEL